MKILEIKRPRLIEPFFNEELLPDNSYATHIETVKKDSVTPDAYLSKKEIKNKYNRFIDNPLFDYQCELTPSAMDDSIFYYDYKNNSSISIGSTDINPEEDEHLDDVSRVQRALRKDDNFSIFDLGVCNVA